MPRTMKQMSRRRRLLSGMARWPFGGKAEDEEREETEDESSDDSEESEEEDESPEEDEGKGKGGSVEIDYDKLAEVLLTKQEAKAAARQQQKREEEERDKGKGTYEAMSLEDLEKRRKELRQKSINELDEEAGSEADALSDMIAERRVEARYGKKIDATATYASNAFERQLTAEVKGDLTREEQDALDEIMAEKKWTAAVFADDGLRDVVMDSAKHRAAMKIGEGERKPIPKSERASRTREIELEGMTATDEQKHQVSVLQGLAERLNSRQAKGSKPIKLNTKRVIGGRK